MTSVSERLAALEASGIKCGLSNITRLCGALGYPERAYQTVHVAGTNGKGSVTAMVHAALAAAGIPTARYTSPHLSTIRERFVIDDAPVSPDAFEAAATTILDLANRLVSAGELAGPPTFFEATTAIGFELFRRAGVEVAVIEVGLGGRFDSTNVITPMLSAITSIALDHEQLLGGTHAAIAFEKAGIIKSDIPVVMGPLTPDAEAVVHAVAAAVGAPVIQGRQPEDRLLPADHGYSRIMPATGPLSGQAITLGLAGAHQAENAFVAYRLLEQFAAQNPGRMRPEAIRDGLTLTTWQGRLEEISLDSGRTLLLDAAHNPHGAHALASHLRTWHPARPPLICSLMGDKDLHGILSALLPDVGTVVLATLISPRAAKPLLLRDVILSIDPARKVLIARSAARALPLAWQCGPLAVVAGSLVLVGEVRDALSARATLE